MIWELIVLGVLWFLFFGIYFLFVRGYALEQKGADRLWQKTATETPRPDERRRYDRRHLPFSVRYASIEQADFQGITLTRDVAKGGMQFPASHPLRHGSQVYLSIELPKTSPLSLFGEVVWQKPEVVTSSHFDTGIRFINLSTSNIIRIARYL